MRYQGDDSVTNGDQQRLELLQALTCLTVSVMEDGRGFKCRMDEGEMSGEGGTIHTYWCHYY